MTAAAPRALDAGALSPTPRRIEMVVPSLVTAGMEMVVATLVRALARRGHEVGVTCTQEIGAIGEQLQSEGVSVALVPAPGVLTNLWPRDLARWFASRRPDIVHVHSGVWLKAARAARLAGGIPVVHTVHGLLDEEPWHERPIKRAAAQRTAAIVTVSEALRRDLLGRVGVTDPAPQVILNGIDTHRFAPGAHSTVLRRQMAVDDAALVIGHVGRMAPVKNHRLLLQAFARVAPTHPTAHLALIGDGELRGELEALVDSLGIRARVCFAGEHREVAPLVADLDIFVLYSFSEGTSISLLEALASGIPCVATAVGGNVAVLDQGAAGRLVPSDDVEALARALDELLAAPALRHELGRRARERALDAYSEAAMTRAYEAVYERALAARHAH